MSFFTSTMITSTVTVFVVRYHGWDHGRDDPGSADDPGTSRSASVAGTGGVDPGGGAGVRGPPDGVPGALPPAVLPQGAAGERDGRGRGAAQRAGAEDVRADRPGPRHPPQARAVFRGERGVGRRGGHGRAPPARERGTGRRAGGAGDRPQRLRQEGGRVVRGETPMERPAGQGRELSGRRLPVLRRGRG